MTKTEADKAIATKLSSAMKLIKECEKLADEHQTAFTFSIAYGAGATYYGRKIDPVKAAALAKLTDEEKEALGISNTDFDDDESAGWNSSSQSC